MDITEDTVVVISGAASGLGKATLEHFVERGARVVALDVDAEAGRELEHRHGDAVAFHETDVTSAGAVQSTVRSIRDRHGSVDVSVSCAGIGNAERVYDSGTTHRLETFNRVLQVNLVGTFNLLRCAAEAMAQNPPGSSDERGVIVNTSSVAAFEGQIGQAAYSASKGGIVGMTLTLARDLAEHNIRCMTVAPGVFDTPLFETVPAEIRERLIEMTPFPDRMGKPREFARLVDAIVENPMLNGEVIRLDGGIRMEPR